jgi:hypothetical protein
MATIITASELRAVLGVSSSLYSDAILTDQIDAAEGIILPMLVKYSTPVDKVSLTDNVATFHTVGIHEFTEGQSVVITGCGSPFNTTVTVLEDDLSEFIFSANLTNANVVERNVIPSGLATLSGASTYVGNANVEAAVLAVSVEIFASRNAPGGQTEGVDFSPAPFRLGRSLFNRVSGLLGPFIDAESMIG